MIANQSWKNETSRDWSQPISWESSEVEKKRKKDSLFLKFYKGL